MSISDKLTNEIKKNIEEDGEKARFPLKPKGLHNN